MHALRRQRGVRGGFIHVPSTTGQVKNGEPSLPLQTMIDGIAIAIATALTKTRDRAIGGGKIA